MALQLGVPSQEGGQEEQTRWCCGSPAAGGAGTGGGKAEVAAGLAGGRFEVCTNLPLALTPVSPSCKMGFFSGCFSALSTSYSKSVLKLFLWQQKYSPIFLGKGSEKNTEETQPGLNEAQSTSVDVHSFSRVRGFSH